MYHIAMSNYRRIMRARLALAAVLGASLALAGCSASPSFESELRSAVSTSGDTIQLSSLDTADGTSFLVVCPYESTDSVSERLGFDWPEAPDYSQVDDRQTVAIIDGGSVVSHAELSRTDADFCSVEWDVLSTDEPLTVDRSRDVVTITPPK